jgi:hypothetical protein
MRIRSPAELIQNPAKTVRDDPHLFCTHEVDGDVHLDVRIDGEDDIVLAHLLRLRAILACTLKRESHENEQ